MAHIRTQLREAVATALEAGASSVSGRVFRSRSFSRNLSVFPCLEVSTPAESVAYSTMDKAFEREITLMVTIYGEDNGDVESALDAVAVEAEEIILALPGWDSERFGMEFEIGTAGETTVGRTELTFAVSVMADTAETQI